MKIKSTVNLIAVVAILLLAKCGNDSHEKAIQNSPAYNMMASAQKPVAFISLNLLELVENSNFKESKDVPLQIKMIANPQIDHHLNSQEQGFKVDGNIPFVVTATENNEFEYFMGITDVVDGKKIGQSLCTYFDGKVVEENGVSVLEATMPLLTGHHITFVWNDKNLVMAYSEKKDTKSIALKMLEDTKTDAVENDKIQHFLAEENDFSSLLFMDNYTAMINHYAEVKISEDLKQAYEGMTIFSKANFEDGSFTFETDLDGEKFINSKYNPINKSAIPSSFLNYLTEDGKLLLYTTLSFNPENWLNTLHATESPQNDTFEKAAGEIGVTPENIPELFDGNLSFSIMNIEPNSNELLKEQGIESDYRPRFLLTSGIKDKAKIEELIKANEKTEDKGGYFSVDGAYVTLQEDKLFVSASEDLIQKLSQGEKLHSFAQEINKPLFGQFVTDVNQLPETYKKTLLEVGGEEAIKTYNAIESIYFRGDAQHTEFKIKLKDKNKNPLEVFTTVVLKYFMMQI